MSDQPPAGQDARLHAPAAGRNRGPITAVLARILPEGARVLELGCGSGEHAVAALAARPDLHWTPSDPDADARASAAAWAASEGLAQIAEPRAIDAASERWSVEEQAPFDALVSINVIHISPWETALGLMEGARRLLAPQGVLYLYGPFMRDGAHTAPSNEAFDASLRARDARWGVRDLAVVTREAADRGLALEEVVEMPANNLSVIFHRTG